MSNLLEISSFIIMVGFYFFIFLHHPESHATQTETLKIDGCSYISVYYLDREVNFSCDSKHLCFFLCIWLRKRFNEEEDLPMLDLLVHLLICM